MAQGEYGGATDNWSIGILTFELLTGQLPYVRNHIGSMMDSTSFGDISYPDYISKEALGFISGLLNPDPVRRTTLREAASHPWITTNCTTN